VASGIVGFAIVAIVKMGSERISRVVLTGYSL
jgi:hypothetical protein